MATRPTRTNTDFSAYDNPQAQIKLRARATRVLARMSIDARDILEYVTNMHTPTMINVIMEDLARLEGGRMTDDELYEHCIDGVDAEHEDVRGAWAEYVEAISMGATDARTDRQEEGLR